LQLKRQASITSSFGASRESASGSWDHCFSSRNLLVAVGFYTECGSILQNLSPKGLHGIFERFRGILHEGEIDKHVQFLIEGLFAIRKAKFQGYPAVRPEF